MAIVFASVGGEDGGCVELGVGVGGCRGCKASLPAAMEHML